MEFLKKNITLLDLQINEKLFLRFFDFSGENVFSRNFFFKNKKRRPKI